MFFVLIFDFVKIKVIKVIKLIIIKVNIIEKIIICIKVV